MTGKLIVVSEEDLRRIVAEEVQRAVSGAEPPRLLLTPEEAAERLGVCSRTLLRWAEKGMPHRRLGDRCVRFIEAEIVEWAKAG